MMCSSMQAIMELISPDDGSESEINLPFFLHRRGRVISIDCL